MPVVVFCHLHDKRLKSEGTLIVTEEIIVTSTAARRIELAPFPPLP
jgi:hypothetical protein